MIRRAITAGCLALGLAASPLAAQDDRVTFSAEDARQCAIWASYLTVQMADDPETVEALLFATNYFVGYGERMTAWGASMETEAAGMDDTGKR